MFTRFHTLRVRLEHHQPRSRTEAVLWEIALFIFKQAWACLFGGLLLTLVLITRFYYPKDAALARYDALFIGALIIQLLMLVFRLETLREAKVILMFHVVGTVMELFKTHIGSWTYPEHNALRIAGVPLFSGFMYASVGSFIARIWRIFDFRFSRYPNVVYTWAFAALVYINFFTNHFILDMRWPLFAFAAVIYGRTRVFYHPYRAWRSMPLLLGFLLVALFIWIAENLSTFAGLWVYPNQHKGWHMVATGKFGSWFLLMMISFILVGLAHRPEKCFPAHPSR